MLHHLAAALVERRAALRYVAQRQRAVAAQVDVVDLNIGFQIAQVVLCGKLLTNGAVARFIMDGGDLEIVVAVVVQYGKQAEITHHLGRQELADKALILEFAHGEVQGLQPVGTGDIREPVAILLRRRLTDALNILEHCEAERVRVNAVIPGAVVRRLEHHVGMAVQELDHKAIRDFALIIEMIEDGVVPEGRPAFIHHLRLLLRIEILAHLAHDAQDLALPRLQQRRVLLHKVEQVLLRLRGIARRLDLHRLFLTTRQGAPQGIHLALQILFAALLPRFLFL